MTSSTPSAGSCRRRWKRASPAAGCLEKLAELSPWLNEAEMADVRPIHFTSRDGLTIHGYLTLPFISPGGEVVFFPDVRPL